jgi:hypothetical protein
MFYLNASATGFGFQLLFRFMSQNGVAPHIVLNLLNIYCFPLLPSR